MEIQFEDDETFESLAVKWIIAKGYLSATQSQLIGIEQRLLDLGVKCKEDGSVTTKVDGYKITTTGRINRSIDEGIWDAVKDRIPSTMWPVQHKLAIDTSGVKWLMENDPDTWAKVAEAFTAKPGKVGFKIEREED